MIDDRSTIDVDGDDDTEKKNVREKSSNRQATYVSIGIWSKFLYNSRFNLFLSNPVVNRRPPVEIRLSWWINLTSGSYLDEVNLSFFLTNSSSYHFDRDPNECMLHHHWLVVNFYTKVNDLKIELCRKMKMNHLLFRFGPLTVEQSVCRLINGNASCTWMILIKVTWLSTNGSKMNAFIITNWINK